MMEMRPEGKKFDSEEEGEGSELRLLHPEVLLADDKEEGEGSELRSKHPEVLVVDDNHMNVEVMQAMLV